MKMHRLSTALLLITLGTLTACADRDDDRATGAERAAADGAPATTDPAVDGDTTPAVGDAVADATGRSSAGTADERSALGVLNAINDHEIAAGQQALDKGVQGEVAAYARMMIDQHSQNREQTNALGPDADAAPATAQRTKGERELAALAGKNGGEYAEAYIDAMVNGHQEALTALDTQLIPAASRADVRAHLTTTREHVARHLEQAKALQDAGAGAADPQTGGG